MGLTEESGSSSSTDTLVFRNSLRVALNGSWDPGVATREEAGARKQEAGSAEALHAPSDSLHLVQEAVELRQG